MSCRKPASYKLIMATLLLSLLNRLLYGAVEAMSFIGLDTSRLVWVGGGEGVAYLHVLMSVWGCGICLSSFPGELI